jgi:hypothetical protein
MSEDNAQSKGGNARALALTRVRRSEIARQAAKARWDELKRIIPDLPRATHGGPDKPLRLAGHELPCYVLPNETRLLALNGLQGAIGFPQGGGRGGMNKIANLLDRLDRKGIGINGLIDRVNSPILFIPPHGGNPAHGYDARILPDICSVLIRAQHERVLDRRLSRMAERAALLQHAFATLGIIGLVDEATGYQNVRARDALQAFLDKFLRKELAVWVKTFPDDFFKELFRLKKWQWTGTSRRPGVVGKYINDLIYDRLGPGVLDELQRKNPVGEKGHRKTKHFQWLTDDIGHPALAQHMYATIGFMRAEDNWHSFITRFHKAFPKKGENLALAFED